jgi:hypothetical protein
LRFAAKKRGPGVATAKRSAAPWRSLACLAAWPSLEKGSWGGRPRDAARWCIVCEMGMRSLDGGTALVCPKAFELLDVLLVNV